MTNKNPELKTLKDFGNSISYNTIEGLMNRDSSTQTFHKIYNEEDLKAEAVKWVKDLDKEECHACKEQDKRSYGWCENCDTAHVGLNKEDIKEWIKHFFNLTKKDLK